MLNEIVEKIKAHPNGYEKIILVSIVDDQNKNEYEHMLYEKLKEHGYEYVADLNEINNNKKQIISIPDLSTLATQGKLEDVLNVIKEKDPVIISVGDYNPLIMGETFELPSDVPVRREWITEDESYGVLYDIVKDMAEMYAEMYAEPDIKEDFVKRFVESCAWVYSDKMDIHNIEVVNYLDESEDLEISPYACYSCNYDGNIPQKDESFNYDLIRFYLMKDINTNDTFFCTLHVMANICLNCGGEDEVVYDYDALCDII